MVHSSRSRYPTPVWTFGSSPPPRRSARRSMVSGPSTSRGSLSTSIAPSAAARSSSAVANGRRATARRSVSSSTAVASKPRAAAISGGPSTAPPSTREAASRPAISIRLPADLVHLARLRRAAEIEAVAGGLGADGTEEDQADRVEVGPAAQRGPHVDLVVAQQTEVETAVGCEPHPVAAVAVRFGDGADEPDHTASSRQAVVARLVSRVDGGQGSERSERGLDAGAVLRVRDEPRACHRRDLAAPERHRLDEADVPLALERQGGQRDDVLLVEATDDDRVQLDGLQSGGLGRLDARPDLRERPPAHDPRQAIRIETVDVDVDAPEACGGESRGERGQPDAVRREGEIADTGDRGESRDDLDEVGTQRRLAARQPELAEPDPDGGARDRFDLRRGQQVGRRRIVIARERHAVDAAEVAMIGERDAQVVDLAAESVARHGTHLRPGRTSSQRVARRAPVRYTAARWRWWRRGCSRRGRSSAALRRSGRRDSARAPRACGGRVTRAGGGGRRAPRPRGPARAR